ncbi:MAG: DUF2085 domain-containing protein [Anaerolineales bacterium]
MGSGDLSENAASGSSSSSAPTDTTEYILAEAERRLTSRPADEAAAPPSAKRDWAVRLNRGAYWMARHWLAIVNTLAGLYFIGAFLAPLAMHWGMPQLGRGLYHFYAPFCHQYPFRSWFLFGSHATYPYAIPDSIVEMNQLRAFVGNAEIGYKIALCQRCVAIYGAIFIAGLVYAWLRRRRNIPSLPMWGYVLVGVVPMGIDGGLQLLTKIIWSLFPDLLAQPYEATPLSRLITGAFFGLGVVGFAYVNISEYLDDAQAMIEEKFAETENANSNQTSGGITQ